VDRVDGAFSCRSLIAVALVTLVLAGLFGPAPALRSGCRPPLWAAGVGAGRGLSLRHGAGGCPCRSWWARARLRNWASVPCRGDALQLLQGRQIMAFDIDRPLDTGQACGDRLISVLEGAEGCGSGRHCSHRGDQAIIPLPRAVVAEARRVG